MQMKKLNKFKKLQHININKKLYEQTEIGKGHSASEELGEIK